MVESTRTPLRILVHVKYCGDEGCWNTNTVVMGAALTHTVVIGGGGAALTHIVVIRVALTQILW